MFDTHNTRRSEAMVVSAIQATQLARAPSGDGGRRESGAATQGGAVNSLSMSQTETVMSQLVEDGWLEKSRKGFYSLSPRGLMELRGWLVATYNDENEDGVQMNKIKFCAACRDIITCVGGLRVLWGLCANGCRVNAVRKGIAQDAFTIIAFETSSACSRRSAVLCARRHGRVISLSASARLR
jgi:hypothetical protein